MTKRSTKEEALHRCNLAKASKEAMVGISPIYRFQVFIVPHSYNTDYQPINNIQHAHYRITLRKGSFRTAKALISHSERIAFTTQKGCYGAVSLIYHFRDSSERTGWSLVLPHCFHYFHTLLGNERSKDLRQRDTGDQRGINTYFLWHFMILTWRNIMLQSSRYHIVNFIYDIYDIYFLRKQNIRFNPTIELRLVSNQFRWQACQTLHDTRHSPRHGTAEGTHHWQDVLHYKWCAKHEERHINYKLKGQKTYGFLAYIAKK